MVPKSTGQSRSTGQDRSTQLLHGVLDMCLLSIIEEEASYGYEMVSKLRDRGLHLASEGSIYPLLSRLQKQGMIESYLVQSSEGPARKYYPDVQAGPGRSRTMASRLDWLQRLGRCGPQRGWQVTDARTVVDRIERYWLETGVPRSSVTEMRAELEQHLALAAEDGRKVSEVVGDDPAAFAESWAAAYRVRRHSTATWSQVQTGEAEVTRKTRRDLILFGVGMGAVVAAVAVAGQGGNDVDNEVWRWLWTDLRHRHGDRGDLHRRLLPPAFRHRRRRGRDPRLGGVAVVAQWLVFFGVSVFALVYLRRFITRQDEGTTRRSGPTAGSACEGVVLEAIDPDQR